MNVRNPSTIALTIAILSLAGGRVESASTRGQLGILTPETLAANNPATGVPWKPGDTYRFVFFTSEQTQAVEADISYYNTFVQNLANATTVYDIGLDDGVTWKVIGSTSGVDARDNTSTNPNLDDGCSIFLLDGSTLVAKDNHDLWDGEIQHIIDRTEQGETFTWWPWTGTTLDGTASGGRVLGSTGEVGQGNSSVTTEWIWRVWTMDPNTYQHNVYALSDPLEIIEFQCPYGLSTSGGEDGVTLEWFNGPVTSASVQIFRNAVEIASGVPADQLTYTDTGAPPGLIEYELIFTVPGETCDALTAMHNTCITGLSAEKTGGVVVLTWTNHIAYDGIEITRNGEILEILPDGTVEEYTDTSPPDEDVTLYTVAPTNGTCEPATVEAAGPFLSAIAALKNHITGIAPLNDSQIEEQIQVIDENRSRFDESARVITACFDLVETYDTESGPLWIARGVHRDSHGDIHWAIYTVMQNIIDVIYTTENIESYEDLLDGFIFQSSANFPGSVDPPADPNVTHTVAIDASYLETWGHEVMHEDRPARKPTGTYLAPGTIATVTVPSSMVGRGYEVRVGAHSWDFSNRPKIRRLDRSSLVYRIESTEVRVASPLGGGIYIEVPEHADAGIVEVQIKNAVRSPYFSAKSFHSTSLAEWQNTERHHPAPWADFQSEKFMMQVPTSWIYHFDDPVTLMQDWDKAMDAINDLMGYPRRTRETMYLQVDLLFRASVYAPGYPSVNITYNPDTDYGGNVNHFLLKGPQYAAHQTFHEEGHGYLFVKFPGEMESNVNLLHVAVWHQKFGYDLDYAFAASLGYHGNPNRTLDNTAVAWMTSFNFSPKEVPMDTAEKAYQLKGHAKFVDIVRLFGWEGLNAFWYSINVDFENGIEWSRHGSDIDDLILRWSESVGVDLRPLFHFWGVHPRNPAALEADLAAENLSPSAKIYDVLIHYKSLVPADNTTFQTFALNWWGHEPSIDGYWTEREHARQWDEEPLYEQVNGVQQRPNGEIYTEDSAAEITARVDELITLYFPGGPPGLSCPYGLSASRGPGGVTLQWVNRTVIPDSVQIFRDQVEIAGAAPVDPPTYTDAGAQPGVIDYELIFTMPGDACESLTTTYDACITDLAAEETPAGAVRLTWVNGLAYPGGIRITRDDGDGAAVLESAYDGAAEEYRDGSAPDSGVVTYTVAPVDGQCDTAEVVIDLRCEPVPEVCDNNKDDDCDGLVDCLDPDCDGLPNCTGDSFRRSDANRDSTINIADAVYILQNLFASGPPILCPDAADANDDEGVNIADAVYILQNLFAGGPAIPALGTGSCGADPTPHPTGGPELPPCDYCPEACADPPEACPQPVK